MVKKVDLETICYYYEHNHEIEKQQDELNKGHQRKVCNLGIYLHFLGQKPSTSTRQSRLVCEQVKKKRENNIEKIGHQQRPKSWVQVIKNKCEGTPVYKMEAKDRYSLARVKKQSVTAVILLYGA